jgi:hypothetical protein
MATWRRFQYQIVAQTLVPASLLTPVQTVSFDCPIISKQVTQYQTYAAPVLPPPEVLTEDKWHQPWSTPVRVVARTPQYQDVAVPLFIPVPASGPATGLIATIQSPTVFVPYQFQYEGRTKVPFAPSEVITTDKWIYPWSTPVRDRLGLRASQQPVSALVLDPSTEITQGFESRWHYAWSEPVRSRQLAPAYQQTFAFQPPSFEVVTTDKWFSPWREPVREKPGLKPHLQQAFIAPVLDPNTQVTQLLESRWHYAWSEPVRARPQLLPALQQAYAAPVSPVSAPAPGPATDLCAPVISTGVWVPYQTQYQSLAYSPFFVAETITVDKWFASWREPVREKPGLRASLQQAYAALVLNPNTQITQGYESRWHYAWSEPVRTRQLPTAQQQTLAQGEPSFEVITVDKWTYPWTEPVRTRQLATALQLEPAWGVFTPAITIDQYGWRQPLSDPTRTSAFLQSGFLQGINTSAPETVTADKWSYPWSELVRERPGLKAYLQQAFIGPVLDPNTQITQGYESRWHYAWSEPVRSRPYQTSLQPFQAFQLDPSTEVTQTYESRWHYPWSEPVRTRQLATAQQQAVGQGEPSFEVITTDKWTYPWSEPVRQKPGLSAYLQHFIAQTVLEPNTQITQGFESRWHYAWSEPVRTRVLPVAASQAQIPPIFIAETITVDKWYRALNEPVRVALRTSFFAPFTSDTATIPISRLTAWFSPLSEPSVKSRLRTPEYRAFTADTAAIPVRGNESLWHYAWSEPVRLPIGLKSYLQQTTSLATPPFPTFLRTIPWYAPFNEPVRLKPGLRPWYQQFYATDTKPPPVVILPISLTLNATEVNADSAIFGMVVYNQPIIPPPSAGPPVVSIEEIPAESGAKTSIEEEQAHDDAATSIEET